MDVQQKMQQKAEDQMVPLLARTQQKKYTWRPESMMNSMPFFRGI